jgi:hypothetical protein
VAGLAGLLLAGLWLLTDHTAAHRNENLFQLNPVSLPLAVLVPLLATRRGRASRATTVLAVTAAAVAVAGVLLRVLPGIGQVNREIIAFALPVHLAIALTAWRLRGRTTAPATA